MHNMIMRNAHSIFPVAYAACARQVMVLCFLVVFFSNAGAFEFTDDRGVVTRFLSAPKRIVSLMPSLTESVCVLGACHLIVGVDRYSNWPSEIGRLPVLGGGLDPDVEAIVALKPDVVLASPASRISDRLAALGIPIVALEANSYADVHRVLKHVAQILNLAPDTAESVWLKINAEVDAAAASLHTNQKNIRVYFEVSPVPYAAGARSFIGETLTRLGVENIIPANLGAFPKINPEFIVLANPDLIMVGDSNFIGMVDRPGWKNIQAITQQHLCLFQKSEGDIVVRSGPRMGEAAKILAHCIQKNFSSDVRGQIMMEIPLQAASVALPQTTLQAALQVQPKNLPSVTQPTRPFVTQP